MSPATFGNIFYELLGTTCRASVTLTARQLIECSGGNVHDWLASRPKKYIDTDKDICCQHG